MMFKLTIALTQSTFAFFNNEKFDIEVIIRCIKNTTLKDMNIDEINKYEFFANDIENFARGNSGTIKKPQQERSKVQSKKYRNCEIIDFHSDENENLCDIPWDHLPTSLKLLSLKFTAVITVSSDIKRLKNLYYFTVFSKYLNHIAWEEDISAEIESLWVKTESNLNIIKLNDKEKLNFLAVESPKLVEFNGLDAPVSLTLLTLDNCELQKFDLMNNFQNLKKLSLNNNEISEIQWETLPLSLEKISFSNNKLKFIGNISHLQQLKEFNARSNEIECISESITTLQNLKDFILSSNKLSSLPNGFENLQNLGVFVLASNKFEMIYIKIYGSDYHHIYIA
uniref:Uncharacterized protein n=1 Tax=Panagrolaimus superbus TaxID=310955 RepID=A0A914XW01_9BILA